MIPTALTLHDFCPLIGEAFVLRAARGECQIRLAAVNSLGFRMPAKAGGRESFALLFHAPLNIRVPQGTHRLVHPACGEHDIFFVPLGPDAHGLRLEAIFNFL